MSISANKSNSGAKGKYQQGSGTKYHKEHAAHVPDYGGNSMEPSAKELSNSFDNK